MEPDPTEESLRLLYLDWCSTRVAQRFLELSVDEVWLRSQAADSQPDPPAETPSPGPGSLQAVDRIPEYLELVRKTALVLAREMDLPSFSEWQKDYLDDPRLYMSQVLGG
jgi:hypothetical protein